MTKKYSKEKTMEFIKALIITAILIGFVTTVFGFIKMVANHNDNIEKLRYQSFFSIGIILFLLGIVGLVMIS